MSRWHKSEVLVASVAAYRDGKLLFGKQNVTGRYVLPGGHLNIGESPAKGAVRELKEETGLSPTKLVFLGDGQVRRTLGNVRVFAFRAAVGEGEPDGSKDPDLEIESFEWVDVSNGVPPHIANNLRDKCNVTLRYLDLQPGEIRKVEDEALLIKAEWDKDNPPPGMNPVDWNYAANADAQIVGGTGPEGRRSKRADLWNVYYIKLSHQLHVDSTNPPPTVTADPHWGAYWGGLSNTERMAAWGYYFHTNPQAAEVQKTKIVEDAAKLAQARQNIPPLDPQDARDIARQAQEASGSTDTGGIGFVDPPPILDIGDEHPLYPNVWGTLNEGQRKTVWGNYLYYHSPQAAQHQANLAANMEMAYGQAPPILMNSSPSPDAVRDNWKSIPIADRKAFWKDFYDSYVPGITTSLNNPPPSTNISDRDWQGLSQFARQTIWSATLLHIQKGDYDFNRPPPTVADAQAWHRLSDDVKKDHWDRYRRLQYSFLDDKRDRPPLWITQRDWETMDLGQRAASWVRDINKIKNPPPKPDVPLEGLQAGSTLIDPTVWDEIENSERLRIWRDYEKVQQEPMLAQYLLDELRSDHLQMAPEEADGVEEMLRSTIHADALMALKLPDVKRRHIQMALKHQVRSVAEAALNHPLVDHRHLQKLMETGDPMLKQKALTHPLVDGRIIDAAVEGWRMTPSAEIQRGELRIAHSEFIADLINHPAFTSAHAIQLAERESKRGDPLALGPRDNYLAQRNVRANAKLPEGYYEKWVKDLEAETLLGRGSTADRRLYDVMAGGRELSPDFVNDFSARVRRLDSNLRVLPELLQQPSLSADEILAHLSTRNGRRYSNRLLTHPHVDARAVAHVLRSPYADDYGFGAHEAALESPAFNHDHLAKMIENRADWESSAPGILQRALEMYATSADLEPLVNSNEDWQKQLVALCPELDDDQVNRLIDDANAQVSRAAAKYAKLEAAGEPDHGAYRRPAGSYPIAAGLAENPNLKPEHLTKMLQGAAPVAWAALKHVGNGHHHLTPAQIDIAMQHPDPLVRTEVLMEDNATHDQLLRALRDPARFPAHIDSLFNYPESAGYSTSKTGADVGAIARWNSENDRGNGITVGGMYSVIHDRMKNETGGESVINTPEIAQALVLHPNIDLQTMGLEHSKVPQSVVDAVITNWPAEKAAENPALTTIINNPNVSVGTKLKLLAAIPVEQRISLDSATSNSPVEAPSREKYLRYAKNKHNEILSNLVGQANQDPIVLREMFNQLSSQPDYQTDVDAQGNWRNLLEYDTLPSDLIDKAIAGIEGPNRAPTQPLGDLTTILNRNYLDLKQLEGIHAGFIRHNVLPGTRAGKKLWDKLNDAMQYHHPDKVYTQSVDVRFGMQKLRKIRDLIIEKSGGGGELHPSQLPPGDWSAGRTPKGTISAAKLDEYINKQTPERYNISHTTWNQSLQTHSAERPQKVLQVNITTDMVNRLKAAGVYDTYRSMNDASFKSGHLATRTGIGWIRYTGDPENGYFVDEYQSDLGQSFVRQAAAQARAAGLDPEEAAKRAEARWPTEHYEKIKSILFKGRHASEVLHEAFLQHLRQNGHIAAPIQTHTVETAAKGRLSKPLVSRHDAPAHMNVTYHDVPKKLGFEPGSYGSLPTQTGDGSTGVKTGDPTWATKVRKKESGNE